MGVSEMGRFVACAVLLTVVLSNSLHPLSKRSVSDCSFDRLDEPLTRIEELLDRIVGDIPTCISTEPTVNAKKCRVDLASYGYEDTPKYGYVRTSGGSSEEILVPEDPQKNRGVVLFELDLGTCTTRNRTHFDTWQNDGDRKRLLTTLEDAKPGTILVGVTADSAEDGDLLKKSVGPFFIRYNMDLSKLGLRDKFAFILLKGSPKKTIFRLKARDKGSLKLTIEVVNGTIVDDVTFKVVSPEGSSDR